MSREKANDDRVTKQALPRKGKPLEADYAGRSEFEPRLGCGRTRKDGQLILALNRAARQGRSGKPGVRNSLSRGRGRVSRERYFQQRVVVKARVVQSRKGEGKGRLRAHINYLARSGVGRDGEAVRFVSSNETLLREEMMPKLGAWVNERHHFRFILSPEKGFELDLERFTKAVMARVSSDLGTKLEWFSACHYNTDNPHAHILLRGTDERGEPLIISRDYIKHGMRAAAETEATLRLGRRKESEAALSVGRNVHDFTLTGIDQRIARLQRQSPDGIVRLQAPHDRAREWERLMYAATISRLHYLVEFDLIKEVRPAEWRPAKDFLDTLRQARKRKVIELRVSACTQKLGVREPVEIHLPEKAIQGAFEGEVVARGVHDELTDAPYVVISGGDGRLHYCALSRFSEPRGFPAREGSIVEAKPSDRGKAAEVIERFTGQTGVFDLDAFRRHVEENHRLGKWSVPEELGLDRYIERFETRCRTLADAGVMPALNSRRFSVPKDLGEKVEALEAKLGVQRFTEVSIRSYKSLEEQIHADGATWLDELIIGQSMAPDSRTFFGRRVEQAAAARRAEHEKNGRQITGGLIERLRRYELQQKAAELSQGFGRYEAPDKCKDEASRLRRYELLSDGYYMVLTHGSSFTLCKTAAKPHRYDIGGEFILKALKRRKGEPERFRLNRINSEEHKHRLRRKL